MVVEVILQRRDMKAMDVSSFFPRQLCVPHPHLVVAHRNGVDLYFAAREIVGQGQAASCAARAAAHDNIRNVRILGNELGKTRQVSPQPDDVGAADGDEVCLGACRVSQSLLDPLHRLSQALFIRQRWHHMDSGTDEHIEEQVAGHVNALWRALLGSAIWVKLGYDDRMHFFSSQKLGPHSPQNQMCVQSQLAGQDGRSTGMVALQPTARNHRITSLLNRIGQQKVQLADL